MNKKELLEECNILIDEGCGMVEVFEFIEDNSDFDAAEIIDILYYGMEDLNEI